MLELKHLTKFFGKNAAVKDVNLVIEKGAAWGLVGESGSGKTTLARMILGLIKPSSGEIIYHGITHLRRQMQIVFQDPQTSLNPRMKVGEALAEPIWVHRFLPKNKINDRVREILEMVKLPGEYARRFPRQLSGGERQRVGIARALVSNPGFLILDEPVSALDVSTQTEILQLLKELKDNLGLTYLFIAHDFGVINFLCDKVAVMREGEIVEVGDKEALFHYPQHPYTQKLLAAVI